MSAAAERRKVTRNDNHIKRYFDTKYKHMVVKLLPGDHYVSGEPSEMLVTVLGSCVAACIRDPETGIGGMNHFMLPIGDGASWRSSNAAMRYGNHAMEVLINDIMKLGCPRASLEIKLFGGGNVLGQGGNIGHSNADFAEEYLRNEGFEPLVTDLRGVHARRIHYFPSTGKVDRLLMRRANDKKIFTDESSYQKDIHRKTKAGGEIEMFD